MFCNGVGLIDGIFDGAMQSDFETKELVGLVERKSMEAVALSGMELTLVPPWMVPRLRVVLGFSGSGVRATVASASSQRGDGIGRTGVSEAVASGAVDGDLKAKAAESLGDGGVSARAIEDDVGSDASGESRLLVEMADAAQIAFAFFSYVGEHDDGSGEREPWRGGWPAREQACR